MRLEDNDFVPVILGTGINSYGIARALHQDYGVKTLAIGRSPLQATSHSKIIEVRTSSSFADEDALLATLLALPQEFPGKKLLLLPTIEAYTNLLVKHRDRLEQSFLVPVIDQDLADLLVNKAEFYGTCEKLCVPHPLSRIVGQEDISSPSYGQDLAFDYPVILKPSDTEIYPHLKFEGQRKIYLVDNAQELSRISHLIYDGGYRGDLIVQEYLRGDETVMRVANTYSDKNGKTKYISIGQIVLAEHHPNLVGNMNAVVTIDEPELAKSLQHLLDSLGYVGAANFDIMFDHKTGTNKILEANLRQGAASYYATGTGHSLPKCYVEDLVLGNELDLVVTTNQILWRNAPMIVISRYIPRALRDMTRTARKNRVVSTLWYRGDLNAKRIISNLKHELRLARSIIRNDKFRINKTN